MRSSKHGYQWPNNNALCSPKCSKKRPLFTLPGLRLLNKGHLLGCQVVDEHIDTAVDVS